jgi:hypothetical protein
MNKFITTSMAVLFLGTSSLYAADCGEPPQVKPTLPNATKSLSADDIRSARNAVINYSGKVTTYLTCMDNWIVKLRPYMTKEQATRFADDTSSLHEERITLEQKMNEIIREYRRNRRTNNG